MYYRVFIHNAGSRFPPRGMQFLMLLDDNFDNFGVLRPCMLLIGDTMCDKCSSSPASKLLVCHRTGLTIIFARLSVFGKIRLTQMAKMD